MTTLDELEHEIAARTIRFTMDHNNKPSTAYLPSGQIIGLADTSWGELSSSWKLTDGPCDPFTRHVTGASQVSLRGLPKGKSALVYALRARASTPEADQWLRGPAGAHVDVAVHYNARVYRERKLNLLLREDLLFGTPLWIRELLLYGVFVVPEPDWAPPGVPKHSVPTLNIKAGVPIEGLRHVVDDSVVTFSLVGYMIGMGHNADMEVRYKELNSAIVAAEAKK